MNTKFKSDYEKACNAYLQAFCEKHGYDYEELRGAGSAAMSAGSPNARTI